ncbi:hypothetical protein FHX15_004337 [Rhizobium sp. BK650]|nr:hypothetical protein [Rhizobium sp. BK650]MBB3659073.1 hypothetical protein [Rhizobium sp. BK650]
MIDFQTFSELRLTDGVAAPIRYPVKALVPGDEQSRSILGTAEGR